MLVWNDIRMSKLFKKKFGLYVIFIADICISNLLFLFEMQTKTIED